jgi:hypothetical protein
MPTSEYCVLLSIHTTTSVAKPKSQDNGVLYKGKTIDPAFVALLPAGITVVLASRRWMP